MSKSNTVILDLEYYNRLRDFYQKLIKGNNANEVYYYTDSFQFGHHGHFVTKDETLNQLLKFNQKIGNDLVETKDKLSKLNKEQPYIKEIKKYNFFKLIWWRYFKN